jgi:HD superfamily phosphohydrolase YqeK
MFEKLYERYITREGSKEFLEWLKYTDFFEAPASTRFHESYKGGLKEHSVKVFYGLCELVKTYTEMPMPSAETIAIIALLHDVCKANVYKTEMRNVKENGAWVQKPFYKFDEDFKFGGHGSKSVYLIQKYMRLTDEEAAAINCHMGGDECFDTFRAYPLAFLLHTADMAATINFKAANNNKGEDK